MQKFSRIINSSQRDGLHMKRFEEEGAKRGRGKEEREGRESEGGGGNPSWNYDKK